MTTRGRPRSVKPLAQVPEHPAPGVQAPLVNVPAVVSRRASTPGQHLAVGVLSVAAEMVAVAAASMSVAVGSARAAGLSWDAIGAATGVPGESARRRHSPVRTAR